MFRKLLVALVGIIASIGVAFAQVDVDKADMAALDGVKGIGPAISKKIVDERQHGGSFKDWADFQARVRGIGEKSAANLSQAGLRVNGQPLGGGVPVISGGAPTKARASASSPAAVGGVIVPAMTSAPPATNVAAVPSRK